MKEMKRKALKGLTLIELIVVMAIFSILLVAIIQFFSPVEKIFKNTAISEKTYAYTNNIEEYIQERLKYADALWVFSDSQIDNTSYRISNDGYMDENELVKICEDYADTYYNAVVKYDPSSSSEHYAKGKIHIMHLINNNVRGFDVGQITERSLNFSADPTVATKLTSSLPAEAATHYMVNEAYFKAGDAKYAYHYSLGSGRLVDYPSIQLGDEQSSRVVDNDSNDTPIDLAYTNMNICIVTNTDDGGSMYDFLPEGAGGSGIPFSAFSNPCTMSVANLPLMNIVNSGGKTSNRTVKEYPTDASGVLIPTATPGYGKQGDATHYPAASFKIKDGTASMINETMNFTDDIYFIFSYADELE